HVGRDPAMDDEVAHVRFTIEAPVPHANEPELVQADGTPRMPGPPTHEPLGPGRERPHTRSVRRRRGHRRSSRDQDDRHEERRDDDPSHDRMMTHGGAVVPRQDDGSMSLRPFFRAADWASRYRRLRSPWDAASGPAS